MDAGSWEGGPRSTGVAALLQLRHGPMRYPTPPHIYSAAFAASYVGYGFVPTHVHPSLHVRGVQSRLHAMHLTVCRAVLVLSVYWYSSSGSFNLQHEHVLLRIRRVPRVGRS